MLHLEINWLKAILPSISTKLQFDDVLKSEGLRHLIYHVCFRKGRRVDTKTATN